MKKFFASIACVAALSVGFTTTAMAQDSAATATEVVDSAKATVDTAAAAVDTAATVAPTTDEAPAEGGFHQAFKQKFIEGGADWMTPIAIALILGLAICLERIVYLRHRSSS